MQMSLLSKKARSTSSGELMEKWPQQIGVGAVQITKAGKEYVLDALNHNRLSYGPYTRRFEQEFAHLHDLKYCVFTNSGTSSLQLALAVLKEKHGWKDGDEVLCPATTFIATSNVILQNNMKPVFVDIDPHTYSIDPAQMEKHITPRTKCVMVVHLYGQPADMDPILAICKKHNLKIIEDSCETMFARYKGRSVGTFGDISCFSTYACHIIVTGVGGLTCTNDPELAVMLRSAANHGRDAIYMSIDDDKGKHGEDLRMVMEGRFRFVRMGYSYRATELEAALGCAELERWEENIAARKRNGALLMKELQRFSKYLQLPTMKPDRDHVFMMFPLLIQKGMPFTREELTLFLEEHNIETRTMVSLLDQPYYHKLFGADIEEKYPVAKWVDHHGFYIGSHMEMGEKEIAYIGKILEKFFGERA
jgi:perosamine synthetase